jgi:hypothetical protein
MSCKGTLTIKCVKEKNCYVSIYPGIYTSLSRQNFEIPIRRCGTLNIKISQSPREIDLVSIIPVEIKPEGIHVGTPVVKSTYCSITINFDAHTNTLTIYPSTNWDNGGKLYMESYWPLVLVLLTLGLLLVAVILMLAFAFKKNAELNFLEKANRHHKK